MSYDYTGFEILHGEDDATDAKVMQKVLQRIKYNGTYTHVPFGHEIIDRVHDKNKPSPDLILLDIGLPGMTGLEILAVLREDSRVMTVPVLMLSGSSSQRDLSECIAIGANGYIKKTSDHEYFSNACQDFIQGWARLSKQKFF